MKGWQIMSEEKRIEDMQVELVAAGCHIYQAGFVGNHPFWVCERPDSVSPENGDYSNHKEFVLRKAYVHYQRERRYAAMEAFIREIAESEHQALPVVQKAKALLGEGAEE
jgi:hypothetical protein